MSSHKHASGENEPGEIYNCTITIGNILEMMGNFLTDILHRNTYYRIKNLQSNKCSWIQFVRSTYMFLTSFCDHSVEF